MFATGSCYLCLDLAVTPRPNPPFCRAGGGGGGVWLHQASKSPSAHSCTWRPSVGGTARAVLGAGLGTADLRRHALPPRGPLAPRTAGLHQETENQGAQGTRPLCPAWQSSANAVPAAASVHCLPLGPQLREVGLPLPSACRRTLEVPQSAQATAASSRHPTSPPHTPVPWEGLGNAGAH